MADWRRHDTSAAWRVPSSGTAGLTLHLSARGDDPARRPILFVHGATFSGRLYDIPHPGANWLLAAAEAGFAAYALDIRGYGRSRPEAPLSPSGPPYARASEAVADIADAAAYLSARHGGGPIGIVGWSWGSVTTSLFASGPGRALTGRLVLYAPIFAERNPGWIAELADPDDPGRLRRDLGAFRRVDLAATRARWDAQIPPGANWRDDGVLDALVAASLADDPEATATDRPSFRVPNGTLVDLWECFNGRPLYDPSRLTCPVLLVRGSEDPTATRTDALALFDRLASPIRRYTEIAGGTHFINAEEQAPQLFAAVHGFLSEPH